MQISESDRERIVEWAKGHPKIRAVHLYGSRARGDNRPDSDIDLAIEMRFGDWFFWVEAYEAKPDLHLTQEVDLEWYEPGVDLERVGTGVERDGILLYTAK